MPYYALEDLVFSGKKAVAVELEAIMLSVRPVKTRGLDARGIGMCKIIQQGKGNILRDKKETT